MSLMSGNDWAALGNSKLEALVEVMFLAAFADGEFSEVERMHFLRSVQSLTDGFIALDRLEALVADARGAQQTEGRDARLALIKARLPDSGSRRVALSLAIQVTAADGIIQDSERALIFEAANALEVSREQTTALIAQLSRLQ